MMEEKIVLTLDAGGVKANSLSALVAELKLVEQQVESVNAALNGLRMGPGAARSVAELEGKIKSLQTKMGPGFVGSKPGTVQVSGLAKALKLDEAAFEAHIARMDRLQSGFNAKQREFLNASRAAEAVSSFERSQVKQRRMALGDLLSGSVSGKRSSAASAAAPPGTIAVPLKACASS